MKNEDRFDQLINIALQEYVEKTESELKTEEELRQAGIEPHTFSPQFERKMEKLIRRQRRVAWRAKHKRGLQRLAASIALFMAISGITIAKVEAFRIPVMSFILNLSGAYSEIKVDRDKPSVSARFDPYLPTYTPDGFFIESVDEYDNKNIDIKYVNDEQTFYGLSFEWEMTGAAVDTENAQVKEMSIQGEQALLIEKKGRLMIIWGINGHMYTLTGYIPEEEGIKILESVNVNFK